MLCDSLVGDEWDTHNQQCLQHLTTNLYIYIYITGYTSSFKLQTLHELLLAVTPPPYWDWYAYLCACLWLCLFLQSRRCSKTERAKDNALVSHVPNECWQTSSWSSWSSFEIHFVLASVYGLFSEEQCRKTGAPGKARSPCASSSRRVDERPKRTSISTWEKWSKVWSNDQSKKQETKFTKLMIKVQWSITDLDEFSCFTVARSSAKDKLSSILESLLRTKHPWRHRVTSHSNCCNVVLQALISWVQNITKHRV